MAAFARLLGQAIGRLSARSGPRAFLSSRIASHLHSFSPGHSLGHPPRQFSNPQTRLSLPVRHALARPFSPPRLPRPPIVPANVTHVGLGTARAFHSGRPIFQNMVDNVPIATRALWEAEWEVKTRKKEARRMRRITRNKSLQRSHEMLKPKSIPAVFQPQCDASELDVYFPVQPTPAVTTHLLVPLAPTPTARLPLSARTHSGDAHPLLPIADLTSIHTTHRRHSLRVSTLFAKLDAANVWDDPGVNVDAYAFGPRQDTRDPLEKQCTILRVTFRGWNVSQVRSVLGHGAHEWYSLEETHPDGLSQDASMNASFDSRSGCSSSEVEMNDLSDAFFPPPIRTTASAQHELVLPTLDFSSTFSDAVDNVPPIPQPVLFLHTISELSSEADIASHSCSLSTGSDSSWERLGPADSKVVQAM